MGIDPLIAYALQHKLITFPAALAVVVVLVALRYWHRHSAKPPQSQSVDMHRARISGNVEVRQEQHLNE